jgi:VanZ family protein
MNKGLRLYRGDAIGYLNSDDCYHDRYALARIAEALAIHDIVHGNLNFVSEHQAKEVVRRWRGTPFQPGAFRMGWMPAHPTFYIRRKIAERTGFFDPSLTIAADYDFMLRAMENGPVRTAFIDHVQIDMMTGGNSTASWKGYVQGNLESLWSRQRWLGSGVVDYAIIGKPARKVRQILFDETTWSGMGQLINNSAFFAIGAIVILLALYPGFRMVALLQTLKDATEPLGHMVAFVALSVTGAIAWGLTLRLLAGLSGLAVGLEFTQFLSPGREPDLSQVAGGLAGILLGLILARFWRIDRRRLTGQASGKSARLNGPGLEKGSCQGLDQGPKPAIHRAAFFTFGFTITVLALYPHLHLTALQALKDATEPLGHTAVFAVLTMVGAITWGLTLPILAGLSGLAAWLELAQILSPGREPDFAHVAGSLAGILLGLMLARLWRIDRQTILLTPP